MESVLWGFRTLDSLVLAAPILFSLLLCFALFQSDYFLLLMRWLSRIVFHRRDSFQKAAFGVRPSGLVVIPSLLRNREDFDAIVTTIDSAATNQYPSDLFIVASVDGPGEAPALYAELHQWVADHHYDDHVHVYVTATPTRLGKMMAVEAGVSFMSKLVADGRHAAFPTVYFSIDGDGTLSPNALEHLAARLTTRHPLSGNPRRVVSGKISIRHDLLWRGWRAFFTVKGQIYNQVAREFLVSNVARFNWKATPQIGLPGALYCTWSEVIRTAPHYMGFMKQLRFVDWLKWLVGFAPPAFSESRAPSLPEALTGASDDTCIAFIASLASWQKGRLSFDAPRTPLHAFGRFLRGFFLERSHDYAPEARVYTYTPSTLKGLWLQRVRWNSSRVECAGRFWRSFWYHWEIGLPVSSQILLLLHTVFDVGFYYIVLPYYCFGSSRALMAFLLGYAGQTIAYTAYTGMALALERERRHCWRVVYCLPVASLYCIAINCFGCVVGVVKDIFLFGNATNFAPEWTLAKGGCERIAVAFRVRRFFALCVRAAIYGDVPLGWFWLGWSETPWTPSGYEGWTTKKRPRAIVPLPSLAFPRRWLVSAARSRAAGVSATFGAVLFIALASESCSSNAAAARLRTLEIEPSRLSVTAGEVRAIDAHTMSVTVPGMRGFVAGAGHAAELAFRYRGPSRDTAPLADGEVRRQIGLALRAKDTCNVVYVMWHVEPTPGIFVSVKYNPGRRTHEQCGAGGYLNLQPSSLAQPPRILAGVAHTLSAQLSGDTLRVFADGAPAWRGSLPAQASTFDGPAGIRSDNGAFDFELRVAR